MQRRQWLFGNKEGILGMGGKDRELQRIKKKKKKNWQMRLGVLVEEKSASE